MKFKSRSDYPVTIYQDLSREVEPVYGTEEVIQIDENNIEMRVKVPVQTGSVNVYEMIQEASKGTGIYDILDRYEKGDVGVLNDHQTVYGDVSDVPTDVLALNSQMKKARSSFDNLDPELKNEFGSDPISFLNNFSDEKLNAYLENKVKSLINKGVESNE